MAQINRNYPDKCSDREIKALIREYSEEIFNSRGHINTVLQFSPLIQLGLNELQARENYKTSKLSLEVSLSSAAIAILALVIQLLNNV